jgi:2-octaprenyl-6-methoxyphenol hydroxylase
MTRYDVIVAGRGPAGLAAACLVALNGARVALVAATQPGLVDPRTIALMKPSIRLLETLQLWPGDLRERTSPLRRLRMVDDTGATFHAPELVFDAAEIGEEAFGWNIPLTLLIPALEARAAELGVTAVTADVAGATPGGSGIEIRTTSGEMLEAKLALAADGRGSVLREAAGIPTNAWAYDQVAVATSFCHSSSHRDISTEYHKPAGPCTTVPMPGGQSALVWMERPARAAELMAMADAELAREIQIATHGELGLVSGIGARRAFPMRGLVARRFADRRVMLIGEAAHVVPPIGAQGLNMSLRDAAQAADLIAGAKDPGNADILADYDAIRRRDVQPRQQAIDLMNRSLLSGLLPMEGARAIGLSLLEVFGPLRRFVMKQGVGPARLPRAMRG